MVTRWSRDNPSKESILRYWRHSIVVVRLSNLAEKDFCVDGWSKNQVDFSGFIGVIVRESIGDMRQNESVDGNLEFRVATRCDVERCAPLSVCRSSNCRLSATCLLIIEYCAPWSINARIQCFLPSGATMSTSAVGSNAGANEVSSLTNTWNGCDCHETVTEGGPVVVARLVLTLEVASQWSVVLCLPLHTKQFLVDLHVLV